MGKFIFDDLTGIPTILAVERSARPDVTGTEKRKGEKPADKKKAVDFFAKGNENLTPAAVYQDQDDWNIRVFPNKYPLMDHHEIIIHSPQPKKDLEDLPLEQTVRYIRAILSRVDFYTSQGLEVFVFNNRGAKAGASLPHPHSQLVADPGFGGFLETEKDGALHYYNTNNSCYWCDAIRAEKERGARVVFESDYYILLAPKASRWGYETKLYPKKHTPNISLIDEHEIVDLAKVLRATLKSYDELLDNPERNYWINTQRYEPYHWHITFMPRLNVLAGIELGTGIWVNSRIAPEDVPSALGALIWQTYAALK